jgi:hypothetical protein
MLVYFQRLIDPFLETILRAPLRHLEECRSSVHGSFDRSLPVTSWHNLRLGRAAEHE